MSYQNVNVDTYYGSINNEEDDCSYRIKCFCIELFMATYVALFFLPVLVLSVLSNVSQVVTRVND